MKNSQPGRTCCVIGYPIRHSLSPVIHNTLYQLYNIDCTYTICEVAPGGLDRFVADIPAKNICGFNVTMPYKKDIIPYLSNKPVGSVNSVAVRDGKLIGISTDETGFAKSLSEAGFSYTDQNIVFIGAGAVTGALAHDAAQKGAKSITLLNRTLDHAQAIAADVGGLSGAFDAKKTYDCIANADVLINTTPQGMAGCPAFESFAFLKNVNPRALVCDLIYRPMETEFLKQAASQGNRSLGGISMLIWQAFYAFEHFFGILPTEQDKEIILAKIKDQTRRGTARPPSDVRASPLLPPPGSSLPTK